MGLHVLSPVLNTLFGFILFVVVTGGFEYQGSIGGHSVRLDATAPDLFVVLFLLLLAVWHRSGRMLGELRCIRMWEVAYSRVAARGARFLVAVVSIASVVFILIPLVRHYSFHSGIDLSLFGQAFWNTLHGDFLFSSIRGNMSLWGEHLNPTVLGILPFYWLWPSPETLLVVQSLALVAGAVPLYALARRELSSDGLAGTIAMAYLLCLSLRQTNLADFHPIALATPLILAAFYFMRNGEYGKFLLFCVLVGGTKETGPIAMGLLGVASLYLGPKRSLGASVVVASLIWFFLNLTVFMPALNPSGVETQLARYSYLGHDPGEILRTVLTRPFHVVSQNLSSRELFYPVRVFGPVAFLPLLTPVGLLTLPYLFINLLEGTGVQLWLIHYQAELIAFVFIATVFGAKRLLTSRSDKSLAAVLTVCMFLFFGSSDIYRLREVMPTADTRRIHQLLERLPSDGRVSAQAALAPHLTQRKWLYVFPEVDRVDWVIVDFDLDRWPVPDDRFKRTLRRLERAGFQPVVKDDTTRIYRRKATTNRPGA